MATRFFSDQRPAERARFRHDAAPAASPLTMPQTATLAGSGTAPTLPPPPGPWSVHSSKPSLDTRDPGVEPNCENSVMYAVAPNPAKSLLGMSRYMFPVPLPCPEGDITS